MKNNMMKKMIFIVGFVSTLAACDGGSSSILPPIEKRFISFGSAQTRAPLNTVANTFALCGIATGSRGTSIVFDNQRVDYNSESNIWEYFPLKYWDSQADHKFAAYAPYSASQSLSFNDEGYPILTNFAVQQNVGNQEALWLSSSIERNVENGAIDMSAIVFTFSPALTRINFKIKKDASVSGTLNLNALRMYNLKSSGNCVYNTTQIVWDTSSAHINTFGYSTNFTNAQEVSFEGITAWQNGVLMIPQQISGISIYLNYTHRPSNVTYSYDKDNITLPGVNWEPGKQITYILTLKPENYIEIGEPIVEPWVQNSLGNDLIIIN